MATTISNGSTTIMPKLRMGAAAELESRNQIHELLGGGVAVTFGEQPLRTGELWLLFDTEAAAWNAVQFHRDGYVFEITDTDVPTLNMTYVLNGSVSYELENDTLSAWSVKLTIQEVTP